MKRLLPMETEVARATSERGPEDDASAAVERKFHGTRRAILRGAHTLEEVFALKQILQAFLTEPTARAQASVDVVPSGASVATGLPPRQQRQTKEEDPQPPESPHIRPHVRASRGSERLLRESLHFEPNFQARMRYYMIKNQRKKEQIRSDVNEKVHEELKLTPTINQRSKRIYRSVHHLHAWEHEKNVRLAELREAERCREVEEVTNAPRLSRVSRCMSLLKRDDDLAQCKVEDRLRLLGLIYEYQQEERQLEAAKRIREAGFKPRLAPHSSGLARNDRTQVYERLHALSKQTQSPNEAEHQSPDTTKPKATVDAAIHRLAELGELYRSKRAEMAQQRDRQSKEMQMRSKLSAKSRVLADKARSNTAEEQHRKCTCCRQPEQDEGAVNPCVDTTQAAAIYARQLEWQNRKEQKWREARERREREERAALVFRNPQYRSAWDTLDIDDNATNNISPKPARHLRANHAFFEKSTKWATEREQELARERQVWDEIHLRDCTFKPTLHQAPRRCEARPPSPRSLLKKSDRVVPLDPGFFSRPNVRTPMLSHDASDVSSDDCVDNADEDSDCEAHVMYFDDREQL